MDWQPCVYILASGRHGTLYIGVTSNLFGRIHQHREGLIKGFTSRYGVFMHGLKLAGVELDRKVLADLAMHEGAAFSAIIAQAKAALPQAA